MSTFLVFSVFLSGVYGSFTSSDQLIAHLEDAKAIPPSCLTLF